MGNCIWIDLRLSTINLGKVHFTFLLIWGVNTILLTQNVAFTGGHWFNGEEFLPKTTFYIKDGVFTKQRPARVDTTIDLTGQYIVPPFTEAHTHNLSSTYGLKQTIDQYLSEGTFYVQVLGCSDAGRKEVANLINHPKSVDAAYTNGGITSTLGHPFLIYEPLAMRLYGPQQKLEKRDEIISSRLAHRDAYWFFDSQKDVDNNWEALLETAPNAIKIMLIDAENQEGHMSDVTRIGKRGLHPKVAAYVVHKAHSAGLKVYAHIATPADFRIGLDIGVDVFAHMPGYVYGGQGNEKEFTLTPYDFQKAKAKGVVITPTAHLALRRLPRQDSIARIKALEKILQFQMNFFKQAHQYNIPLALGSDDFGETLMKEVDYLYQNQLLSEQQLLVAMTKTGSELCFPQRKIGQLKEGYEGSLLVLNDDPIQQFNTLRSIALRIKQGEVIMVE